MTGKVFAAAKSEGWLDDRKRAIDLGEGRGETAWKGHIANLVYQEVNGEKQLMVIDPLRDRIKPIPFEKWIQFITKNGKYKFDFQFTTAAQYGTERGQETKNQVNGNCAARSSCRSTADSFKTTASCIRGKNPGKKSSKFERDASPAIPHTPRAPITAVI